MGLNAQYVKMFTMQVHVRTYGCNIKHFVQNELAPVYPHCYRLLPKSKPFESHDPYILIGFTKNRKTGIRRMLWVIRGYEQYEIYNKTLIYIPNAPLYFAPHEDRDQSGCFLRLLDVGFHNLDIETFLEYYGVKVPDHKHVG